MTAAMKPAMTGESGMNRAGGPPGVLKQPARTDFQLRG